MNTTLHGLRVAVLAGALAAAGTVGVRAQGLAVEGTVVDNRHGDAKPVPGLKVVLVHPSLAHAPLPAAITNRTGRFVFASVPPKHEPYYLEIYWGVRLIYRQPVRVGAAVAVAGRVQLKPVVFGHGGS